MSESFLDDQMLISRAQQGDKSAFNTLIRKHEARAYQYAFRLTRRPEEAADIVADGFVRVFNALHNFQGQSAFSTWLYRILTNCYLDARKKERNRVTTSLESVLQTPDGELERQIEDPSPSPYHDVEKGFRERTVEEAVAMLPEYQRAMIVMYHSESLTYEEIAAALDLPVGTVKSRLNRARISLRELLVQNDELFRL